MTMNLVEYIVIVTSILNAIALYLIAVHITAPPVPIEKNETVKTIKRPKEIKKELQRARIISPSKRDNNDLATL